MILPKPKDAIHKAWLYRLLEGLLDNAQISEKIFFKGGSCASMLGFLNRFSVDLDFDIDPQVDKKALRPHFYSVFKKLNLEIKDEFKAALQFFLKYPTRAGQRNTIKLDIIDNQYTSSQYQTQYLEEIDRYAQCQTMETMFAHKLCALLDRFEKNKSIAGRDIYDLHYFFSQGYQYSKAVIQERAGKEVKDFLKQVYDFVEKKVSQKVIDQDLNVLLTPEKFTFIREKLKKELLVFLKDEIKRLRD